MSGQKQTTRRKAQLLFLPGIYLLSVSILSGCSGAPNSPTGIAASPTATIASTNLPVATANPTNTVVIILPAEFGPTLTPASYPPTETVVPITPEPLPPNATAGMATQIAFETRVAHNQETRLALITRTPFDPYPTLPPPEPSPTAIIGWIPCGLRANQANPWYTSCWQGHLNGRLLGLFAGREQLGGDPEQGVLLVVLADLDQVSNRTEDVYQTPQKVGAVHLSELNGTQVTLLPDDAQSHVIFTFDLGTRQWVTPAPSPVPSLLPTP